MGHNFAKEIAWTFLLLVPFGGLAQTWEEFEAVRSHSTEEILELRRSAVNGNSDASYELSLYYSDYKSFSFIEHFFFLLLSAEQGDCRAVVEFYRLQQQKTLDDGFQVPGDWGKLKRACSLADNMDRAVLK